MTSYEIRELQDGDMESVLACARATFGDERAKDRAQWEWAFGQPGLARRGIVACREGQLVAAYLGIAQEVWIGGRARLCVQPVDLMVHPDHRRGLQRRGLYFDVAQAFIEGYGVQGEDVFHYGWPVEAARRSGQKLLGYEFLREELCLLRDVAGAPEELPGELSLVREFGEDLRWLWDRCASEWGAATIRNGDWARWRFLERPGCEYQLIGVRDGETLRGLAVLRATEWEWPGVIPLCDWLVPKGEREVAELLDLGVRSLGARWGANSVVALMPDSSGAFASFQERGWRVRSSPFQSVVRSYDRDFDVDWLRAHWWYTLADSDLV